MQPLHGFLVAPLQVVDQQYQRMRAGEYCPSQGLEEVVPLPTLAERRGSTKLLMFDQQLGQDSDKLRKLRRGEGGKYGTQLRAPYPLRDGRVGQVAFRCITPGICARNS